MNCPACQETIEAPVKRCPYCGAQIIRLESGVLKTSAVLVASGETHAVFASLREVPEPLRKRVVESTRGRNSGTILIADRRGKEEIERAARFERVPSPVDARETSGHGNWPRLWPVLAALAVGILGATLAFLVRW